LTADQSLVDQILTRSSIRWSAWRRLMAPAGSAWSRLRHGNLGPSPTGSVTAVNAHVREAHDSYELEEFILAAAEDEPEGPQP